MTFYYTEVLKVGHQTLTRYSDFKITGLMGLDRVLVSHCSKRRHRPRLARSSRGKRSAAPEALVPASASPRRFRLCPSNCTGLPIVPCCC